MLQECARAQRVVESDELAVVVGQQDTVRLTVKVNAIDGVVALVQQQRLRVGAPQVEPEHTSVGGAGDEAVRRDVDRIQRAALGETKNLCGTRLLRRCRADVPESGGAVARAGNKRVFRGPFDIENSVSVTRERNGGGRRGRIGGPESQRGIEARRQQERQRVTRSDRSDNIIVSARHGEHWRELSSIDDIDAPPDGERGSVARSGNVRIVCIEKGDSGNASVRRRESEWSIDGSVSDANGNTTGPNIAMKMRPTN